MQKLIELELFEDHIHNKAKLFLLTINFYILGDKEIESSTLAIRDRKGSDLGSMSIDAFSEILINKIESKEV